jgi:hypothetical protein
MMVFVINNRNYPICNDGGAWWRSLFNCGLPQSDVVISQLFPNIAISCFAVAKVKPSMSPTIRRNCTMVAPSVVQTSSTKRNSHRHARPLMPVSLDMLAELMGFIATMNTTSAATFNKY